MVRYVAEKYSWLSWLVMHQREHWGVPVMLGLWRWQAETLAAKLNEIEEKRSQWDMDEERGLAASMAASGGVDAISFPAWAGRNATSFCSGAPDILGVKEERRG